MPILRRADVCANDGQCTPARVAESADTAGTLDGPVLLRPGEGRDLYVRLADAPDIELDVDATGATLHLEVAAEGTTERRAVDSPVKGRRTIRVALAPFAGRVTRLALRVVGEGPTSQITIRTATLRGSLSAEAPLVQRPVSPADRPPNVIVYVIDTLRADHVGCYGYGRPTTPRIDEFARSAVRFNRAVAQSSWTLPSAASILTGLEPRHHGAIDPDHAIRPDVATLAETLAAGGWNTAAFVTNYLGSGVFGLARGFQTYRFYREQGAQRRAVYLRSDAAVRRVERWLTRGPSPPFFLYVHVTDPHFPYVPPSRTAKPFLASPLPRTAVDALTARVRALHNGQDEWGTRPAPVSGADIELLHNLYDGEIRFADEYFGKLLDALARRGLLDDSVVVLTSDHGEEFLEHGGVGHGQTLHGEVLNVPMLLRLPGGAAGGTSSDRLVQQVDVLPTILDAVGLTVPAGLDGSSWLAPWPSSTTLEAPILLHLGSFEQEAVVAEGWKAIRDFAGPPGHRVEIFDTRADRGELHDVAGSSPLLLGYARARLRELAGTSRHGPRVPDERLDRLRALGYLVE
jgi:arylsulfatase A-like enzyme